MQDQDVSVFLSFQTVPRPHLAFRSVFARVSFPRGKRLDCEDDRSSRSSAQVRCQWSYISTPPYAFMTCTLLLTHCVVGPVPRGKRLDCEADRSSRSSAQVRCQWSYISTPPYAFMTCTLLLTHSVVGPDPDPSVQVVTPSVLSVIPFHLSYFRCSDRGVLCT